MTVKRIHSVWAAHEGAAPWLVHHLRFPCGRQLMRRSPANREAAKPDDTPTPLLKRPSQFRKEALGADSPAAESVQLMSLVTKTNKEVWFNDLNGSQPATRQQSTSIQR